MNIVILGSQGSGKGTQAKLLAEKYGLTQIETGKLLRDIAETDHPWGKRIKSMMLKGGWVSDKIWLEVSEAEAVKRIPARRICKNCGRIYNRITGPPPGDFKCEWKGELVQRE